jgi:hypothetical protein
MVNCEAGVVVDTYNLSTVIPVLRRQRQKDLKFKATLGYIARPCLKKIKNKMANCNVNSLH